MWLHGTDELHSFKWQFLQFFETSKLASFLSAGRCCRMGGSSQVDDEEEEKKWPFYFARLALWKAFQN